jgi:hypothetical protein
MLLVRESLPNYPYLARGLSQLTGVERKGVCVAMEKIYSVYTFTQ